MLSPSVPDLATIDPNDYKKLFHKGEITFVTRHEGELYRLISLPRYSLYYYVEDNRIAQHDSYLWARSDGPDRFGPENADAGGLFWMETGDDSDVVHYRPASGNHGEKTSFHLPKEGNAYYIVNAQGFIRIDFNSLKKSFWYESSVDGASRENMEDQAARKVVEEVCRQADESSAFSNWRPELEQMDKNITKALKMRAIVEAIKEMRPQLVSFHTAAITSIFLAVLAGLGTLIFGNIEGWNPFMTLGLLLGSIAGGLLGGFVLLEAFNLLYFLKKQRKSLLLCSFQSDILGYINSILFSGVDRYGDGVGMTKEQSGKTILPAETPLVNVDFERLLRLIEKTADDMCRQQPQHFPREELLKRL